MESDKIWKLTIRKNDLKESLVDIWRFPSREEALRSLTHLRYLIVTQNLGWFAKVTEEKE